MPDFSRREFVVASAAAFPALRMMPRPIIASAAEDRMAWWREARFGLFLHWGLYSILAGVWDGKDDYAEWIRNNAHIPVDVYDKLVPRWNPTEWDPDRWAAQAKHAGMKYAVLTTKHHDGFCQFDSAVTDFDVMSTPAKRDTCRDLSTALRKQGIRVGWYHSIMDWHHPDYLPRRDWEKATRPVDGADFSRFVTYLHASVDEILSDYGDIDVLWFDGNWEATWTYPLAKALFDEIRTKHPGVIINNRINGAGTPKGAELGDYGTPEQQIPATGIPGKDWESCITMNDNWGYQAADHNWKSPRQLADLLVETASKGGNLLLNVGPMANGRFPPEAVERLQILGDWMADHGDAIHGTTASLFPDTLRFRSTTQGNTVHLFVSDWSPGAMPLPGLQTRPARAWARLGGGKRQTLPVTGAAGSFAITLPAMAPATLLPVVTVEFGSAPVVR